MESSKVTGMEVEMDRQMESPSDGSMAVASASRMEWRSEYTREVLTASLKGFRLAPLMAPQ